MCGIAGILAPDGAPDPDEVRRMLDVIAHRGPDGSGCWADGPVALGHVRLAILDLSDAAAQPMASRSGRLVVSYNGEVFNFPSLRTELGDPPLTPAGATPDARTIVGRCTEPGGVAAGAVGLAWIV